MNAPNRLAHYRCANCEDGVAHPPERCLGECVEPFFEPHRYVKARPWVTEIPAQ